MLVSVGAGNTYRHPDPVLLGRLERAGAAVRRTDTGGDVAVVAGESDEEDGRPQPEVVTRGAPLQPRRRGRGPPPAAERTRPGAAQRFLRRGWPWRSVRPWP